jgi:AraC-like DNA-binding protein
MEIKRREIERFILENLENPNFDVHNLSRCFGFSVSGLFDFVYDIFGTTPYRLIETYRIDRAIDLIASGVKMKDVFKKCGYWRARTFRGAFKRRLGISPMEFKREIENGIADEVVRKYKMILWKEVRK